jgi:tetratricopeptide (TPR) repeat protein
VVVGTLGNNLRVEFKAVGDTVNLASRMEGLAEPGTTYVSGETFKLTEGLFRFEGLGEKEIKGKEEPALVYRVIAPSTRRTRFDVSAERGLTPFVGRERELELLLDALERVKEGRGQAVSIVAAAGEGKSRLLYELRKSVANEDVTFLEGKCLSYGRGVSYHPMIDILKGNFDIRERDQDESVRDKVQRGLKLLEADDAATAPYLLELLSVKESGIDLTLSPEARKDRTIQALNRLVLKGSEIRPIILSVEDLHWMDQSSEDVFRDLLEHIAGARVLLLFTYRPEYVHTWGGRSYHSQVNLNRLSNRETLTMATHILSTEAVPEDLETLILEKTEGVPFFIEEFLKSLRDLQIVEKRADTYALTKDPKDVTIPSTIQDVLMARVDALPEGAKEVLQTGAAIEREFSHELPQKVASLPEPELLTHLSTLKDAELLYERGVYPHSTYIFKHALTREVLYDSILSRRRQELHETIGRAMEDLYQDTIGEHYGILCEHFVAGENYAKGAEYARLIGKKAERDGLFVDALAYCEQGISCLEKLSTTAETQKKIIDARTILGLYVVQTGNFAQAMAVVDVIFGLALKSGNRKRISQIHTIAGAYKALVEGDIPEAVKYLTEALRVAEEIHHAPSQSWAHYYLGSALGWNCQWEESSDHFKQALNIGIAARSPRGIVTTQGTMCMCCQGSADPVYQITQAALELAEESGDIFSKVLAYTYHGWSSFWKGSLEEAVEILLAGADFCKRISAFRQDFDVHTFLGHCYIEIGDYERPKEHACKAISIAESMRYRATDIGINRITLAMAMTKAGETGIDLKPLYTCEAQNTIKRWSGLMRRNIAFILLNMDGDYMSEAESWIQRAIEADRQNRTTWDLAKDYDLYGDWYQRNGDLLRARENRNRAIEVFRKCGADGWVKRTEEKLAQS